MKGEKGRKEKEQEREGRKEGGKEEGKEGSLQILLLKHHFSGKYRRLVALPVNDEGEK
jgi:hypothetical protein